MSVAPVSLYPASFSGLAAVYNKFVGNKGEGTNSRRQPLASGRPHHPWAERKITTQQLNKEWEEDGFEDVEAPQPPQQKQQEDKETSE